MSNSTARRLLLLLFAGLTGTLLAFWLIPARRGEIWDTTGLALVFAGFYRPYVLGSVLLLALFGALVARHRASGLLATMASVSSFVVTILVVTTLARAYQGPEQEFWGFGLIGWAVYLAYPVSTTVLLLAFFLARRATARPAGPSGAQPPRPA